MRLIVGHKLLNILGMIRDAVFSNKAAAVFRDQHVVFYTDASKVFISFELIKVEEFCTMFLCLPIVDVG